MGRKFGVSGLRKERTLAFQPIVLPCADRLDMESPLFLVSKPRVLDGVILRIRETKNISLIKPNMYF